MNPDSAGRAREDDSLSQERLAIQFNAGRASTPVRDVTDATSALLMASLRDHAQQIPFWSRSASSWGRVAVAPCCSRTLGGERLHGPPQTLYERDDTVLDIRAGPRLLQLQLAAQQYRRRATTFR
jgi:hypothetical protein